MKNEVQKLKRITDYKNFSNESFCPEFLSEIGGNRHHDCFSSDFYSTFLVVLNKHAPAEKVYIRANNNFMDKELNQVVMVTTSKEETVF